MPNSSNSSNRRPKHPDRPGNWLHEPTQITHQVYPLEPVGGILCYYDESVSHTDIWDSDEFLGHVPVHRVDGPWTFISESDTN